MFTLDPYKLSYLNIGLLAIYFGWFLKFKPKLGWAILLLSIIPILSFFRNTDFNGGLIQNSAFLAAFYQNLSEGNIIPRWAMNLDTYFGYPAFLYIYPLPFYIGSIFHFLGASFVNSSKLTFVITYILSGFWMWKLANLKFRTWPAFASTVAYLFAPYRFINMHLRLDIGESVAVALLPWLFWYAEKGNYAGITLLSFFLILAHPAISVTGFGMLFCYLIFKKQWKKIIFVAAGVMMACYYWLPILLESKYSHLIDFTQKVEFFPWQNYIYSPYRWGMLYQGGEGKLVFPIGYSLIAVVIFSFVKLKVLDKRIKFWLAGFLIIFFMLLPISEPIWRIAPLINKFQFSYRVLGVMTIVTAIITGYFFQSINKYIKFWVIVFSVVTVSSTMLNWKNPQSINTGINDQKLLEILPVQSRIWGTGFPQALPKWTSIDNLWGPDKVNGAIEILNGTGNITKVFRVTNRHEYRIIADSDLRVRENTFYYPGWKLYVNDKEMHLKEQNINSDGAMEFNLPKGDDQVVLQFTETSVRKFALLISTVFTLLVLYFLCNYKNVRTSKHFY